MSRKQKGIPSAGSLGADPISAGKLHATFADKASPMNVFKVGAAADAAQRLLPENRNFPVALGADDEEDEKYAIQKKVISAGGAQSIATGVVPGMGQVIVGDEYFNYLRRKMKQTQLAEFETFIMENAELDSPEKAEWWYDHFPFILDKKMAVVNYQSKLQKKAAEVQLVGPKSVEDWEFLFMLKNGLIEISKQPVHLLPADTTYNGNINYQAGMFSPLSKPAYIPPQMTPAPNFASKIGWANPGTLVGTGGAVGRTVAFPGTLENYLR